MADSAPPSTPSSARPHAPAPGSARHLKRLSLSSSSWSQSANGHSPLAATAAQSPSSSRTTPTSAHKADHVGVRALRTSVNGSLPPSSSPSLRHAAGPSPSSSAAAGPLADAHHLNDNPSSSSSSSPSLLRRSTSYRSSPAAAAAGPSGSAAPGTPPVDGSASLRRSHSRRGASVSYTGRSSRDGLALTGMGGGGSPAQHASAVEGAPHRADATPSRSRGSTLSDVRETGATQEGGAPEPDSGAAGAPAAAAMGEPGTQPPTLVEQNADLLSFIAKRERKCLDLREELKRHESELAQLKKKWESIVARSLQQQHVQARSPNPNASSSHGHPRNPSVSSTVSSASPNTSPTPRSHRALHSTHSLDLSLLSSTFDGTDLSPGHAAPAPGAVGTTDSPIEIPESVKAAGTWLGDALGRVLEVAVGMPPPTSEAGEVGGHAHAQVQGLGIVEEEDEEDEAAGGEGAERARRRESKVSSVETDGVASTVGAPLSTAPSSLASSDDVGSSRLGVADPASPARQRSPMRTKPTPPRSTSPQTTRQHLFTPPSNGPSTNPHSTPPSSSLSHSRSRSTALDALSGGWSSLNRKWTQLSESDTLKNTRRATLGLVDTFEQGLAQALGPLEPPQMSPPLHGHGHAQLPRASPSSTAAHAQAQRDGREQVSHPLSGSSFSSSTPRAPPSSATTTARDPAPLPGALVPGQGLSSVFASFSRSPALGDARESERKADGEGEGGGGRGGGHAPQEQAQAGWDWSAFLPGSASSEELARRGTADEQQAREGKGKLRASASSSGGMSDGLDEWPGW